MIEGGHRPRLLLEPLQAIGLGSGSEGDHLHRHVAAEPRVAGAEHLAHPARAERTQDFVVPELRARGHGGRRHGCGSLPREPDSASLGFRLTEARRRAALRLWLRLMWGERSVRRKPAQPFRFFLKNSIVRCQARVAAALS